MNLNYFHSYKLPAVIAFFIAMFVGSEFYRIRELLAALVMFTLLFGILGMAFLMMFLVEQSALKGVSYFEAGLARVRAEHHNSSVQLHPDPAFRGPRWN
jgi:putative effector of murein hydrolase